MYVCYTLVVWKPELYVCVCMYVHMYICYAVVVVPGDPLCSYHGNLKSVWVCVCVHNTFVVVLVVTVETK
jgi:hypothetical protein